MCGCTACITFNKIKEYYFHYIVVFTYILNVYNKFILKIKNQNLILTKEKYIVTFDTSF